MMQSHAYNAKSSHRHFPGGLTLIEMIVSVSILVIVILAVGLIFQGASNTVGVSQKTMEILSNVRSIQTQIERDVAGMDKNCFLVIRSAPFSQGRCDLVSFISYGSFPHRTGTTGASPFTDNHTVSPSAFITWGQLVMEKSVLSAVSDYVASNQQTAVLLSALPTGIVTTSSGVNTGGMALGRNAMLLAPQSTGVGQNSAPAGDSVAAYQNNTSITPYLSAIDCNIGNVVANSTTDGGTPANITQSRVDLAATTPSQIMNYLMQAISQAGGRAVGVNARYEADHFCYRHAAVTNVYDGLSVVNGYFRMHPIALQGVSSFAVEWTDGISVYAAGNTDPVTGKVVDPNYVGTTKWFGLGNSKSGGTLDPNAGSGAANGDSYCAVFSYDTPRTSWPVALRFRYHVADPSGRLAGGRDFTQIVKLPN